MRWASRVLLAGILMVAMGLHKEQSSAAFFPYFNIQSTSGVCNGLFGWVDITANVSTGTYSLIRADIPAHVVTSAHLNSLTYSVYNIRATQTSVTYRILWSTAYPQGDYSILLLLTIGVDPSVPSLQNPADQASVTINCDTDTATGTYTFHNY